MKKLWLLVRALVLAMLSPVIVFGQETTTTAQSTAETAGQSVEDVERRGTIEQKFTMAFEMLYQSASIQRVWASDRMEAKRILAEAQDIFVRAREALGENNLTLADDLLNESLRQMGKALRLVSDHARREEQRRLKFARQLGEIQAFQASQLLSMRRISAEPTGATRPPEIDRIRDIMQKAQGLAEKDRYEEANQILAEARELIIGSITKLLAFRTLINDLRFDSPSTEYEYEIARHHSYEDLVPIAVAKFNPPAETVKGVENLVTRGKNLRAASGKQATDGDFKTAVKTLRDATDLMQRALELAGVVFPQ